jgi:hypothetical protein
MGILFSAIGAGIIVFMASKTSMTCTRVNANSGTCIWKEEKLLENNTREIAVANIVGAEVDEDYDEDGTTYCVYLKLKDGDMKFTGMYSSGSGAKYETAQKINQFVSNKEMKTLYVEQDDRWMIYIIGGIFFVVGLGMFFGGLFSVISFL